MSHQWRPIVLVVALLISVITFAIVLISVCAPFSDFENREIPSDFSNTILPTLGASKHLSVNSNISEAQVLQLLEFNGTNVAVESLSLHVNNLCRGRNHTTRAKHLQVADLPNLKELIIANSSVCNYIAWIFRWTMPNVETIVFDEVTLYGSMKDDFRSFMQKHKVKMVKFKNTKHLTDVWAQIAKNCDATVAISS